MRNLVSRNPFTSEILEQISHTSQVQLSNNLALAKEGYQLQCKRTTKDKQSLIKDLVSQIQNKKGQLAKLITVETGKPIREAQFQVTQALKVCRYYGQHKEGVLPVNIKTEAKKKTLVKYLPLGTVFFILPKQYPLLFSFYKIIPQLLLGNGVLVRHSHKNIRIAKNIQKLMKKAGFESGEYQTIWNSHEQVEDIIKSQVISCVSFTGHESVGKNIAAIAGKCLKKCQVGTNLDSVLILLQDGNASEAAQKVLKSDIFNYGQGISPKRLIVHSTQFLKLKDALVNQMKTLSFGDPLNKQTDLGPLIDLQTHQRLTQQFSVLRNYCQLIYQRTEMQRPFFPLTLLISKQPQPFSSKGPIFQLLQAPSDEACIALANNSISCPISYVFSQQNWKNHIDELASDSVFVNNITYFDPHVPLGMGAKCLSRQGRTEGVHKFSNVKTNWIN